jgi:hypothetical protein
VYLLIPIYVASTYTVQLGRGSGMLRAHFTLLSTLYPLCHWYISTPNTTTTDERWKFHAVRPSSPIMVPVNSEAWILPTFFYCLCITGSIFAGCIGLPAVGNWYHYFISSQQPSSITAVLKEQHVVVESARSSSKCATICSTSNRGVFGDFTWYCVNNFCRYRQTYRGFPLG